MYINNIQFVYFKGGQNILINFYNSKKVEEIFLILNLNSINFNYGLIILKINTYF